MDDAAAGKPILLQDMLHDLVVRMGICPQTVAALGAPGDHLIRHPFAGTSGSQPVQRAIGQGIVQPPAVLNGGIGGVCPQHKGEHRLQLPIDHIYKQAVGGDILLQQLAGRVTAAPLGGVARFSHQAAGMIVNLQDPIQIRTGRSTKHPSTPSLPCRGAACLPCGRFV